MRVVSIGVPVEDLLADPGRQEWRQYSVEFCGGTHLASTQAADAFALVSEEGIAKVCSGGICSCIRGGHRRRWHCRSCLRGSH